MSNAFTVTVAIDLVGVGGISSGDYVVDWKFFTPWFSAEDLYHFTPEAIAYEGFDVANWIFDSSVFPDIPPGFTVSSPSWSIATSGVGTEVGSDFVTSILNDGSQIVAKYDFNWIYRGDAFAPVADIVAAYDWILPNRGLYLTAVVDKIGAGSFPSPEVVKAGFQLQDITAGTEIVSTGTPVLLTRTSGNSRYFMFPFTVGGSAPPPDSAFWTNFVSCVEDV